MRSPDFLSSDNFTLFSGCPARNSAQQMNGILWTSSSRHLFRRALHAFGFAQVAPVIAVGAVSDDLLSLSRKTQVCVNDGEHTFFAHPVKQLRRDDLNSGKRQRLCAGCIPDHLSLLFFDILLAT